METFGDEYVRSGEQSPSYPQIQVQAGEPSLGERYSWLEAMINHVPDYIYAKDLNGRFLFANEAVLQGNGLTCIEELIGRTDFELHGQIDASAIAEIEQKVIETGEPDFGYAERALKGGPDRWLMMSRVPLRNRNGDIIGVVGASRDITARKISERLMSVQTRLLEMIVASTPLQEFMERFALLLQEVATGVRVAVLLARDDGELEVVASPSHLWLKGEKVPVGHRAAAVDMLKAAYVPDFANSCHYKSLEIISSEGNVLGLVVVERCGEEPDVAFCEFVKSASRIAGIAVDRIRTEERTRYLADYDALTGLLRRSRLDAELRLLIQQGKRHAVAFLDLDNFKLVNDSLGHEAGDELLTEISSRISAFIGNTGLVARIGGDEFAVVLSGVDSDFIANFDDLRRTIGSTHFLKGMALQTTASIGVAVYPEHGDTASQLLAHADMAMYRAKLDGRNGTVLFYKELADEASRKLLRIEELRRAICHNELLLHFQPQKNIAKGVVTGVEALVRWQHPREGLISPCDFIPLAEETGLILDLGRKVLEMACHQAKQWENQGLPPLRMCVNMSARQFQEPGLITLVEDVLKQTGLAPERLEIEITESLIMKDVDLAVKRMDELTELGISLALDDFGTGYSSLSMLKRFPLSRLKIDRTFVSEIPDDKHDMAIVSAIISLARTMDLQVTAEGVETERQMAFLLKAGCEEAQGYFTGYPQPANMLNEVLCSEMNPTCR